MLSKDLGYGMRRVTGEPGKSGIWQGYRRTGDDDALTSVGDNWHIA
jgi:hypothetical protein